MRTTIMLPDDLFRRAKAEAALEGRTLTSLIEEALTARLASPPPPRKRIKLPVDRAVKMIAPIDLSDNATVRAFLDGSDALP